MSPTNVELDALTLALKMERDGYKFFSEARDKARHPLAKETFRSLTDWEVEHINIIKKYYNSLKDTGQWGAVDTLRHKKGQTVRSFKTVFEKAIENIDTTVKTDSDLLDVYRFAKDIEDKLLVFYKHKAAEASDKTAVKFYTFMADQEREHHIILDNSLRYLENPTEWAADEEGWMFDGG